MANPLDTLPSDIRKKVVLAIVPTTCTPADWSMYNHAITIVGSPHWQPTKGKCMIYSELSAEYLQVAANQSLLIGDMTIFWSGIIQRQPNNCYIISNFATGPWFYLLTNNIVLYDKTDFSLKPGSVIGAESLAVTATAATSKPEFFVDGSSVGLGNAAITPTPGLNPWFVNGTTGGSGMRNPTSSVLLFSDILTAGQLAITHDWSQSLRSYHDIWSGVDWPPSVARNEPGVVGAWALGHWSANRKSEDRSVNSNDCQFEGHVQPVLTPAGWAAKFDGVSGYGDAGTLDKSFTNGITVRTRFIINETTGDTQALIGGGGGFYLDLRTAIHKLACFSNTLDDTFMQGDTDLTEYGVVHEAVFTYDGSVKTLYLDGQEEAVEQTTGVITIGPIRFAMAAQGVGRYLNGCIFDPEIYDYTMDSDDVAAMWAETVAIPTYRDNFQTALVSLAPEGGSPGGQLSNTGWKFDDATGLWKLDEDADGRFISCENSGALRIYLPMASTFGVEAFEYTGTAALTQNTNSLQIDATTGAKIRQVRTRLKP